MSLSLTLSFRCSSYLHRSLSDSLVVHLIAPIIAPPIYSQVNSLSQSLSLSLFRPDRCFFFLLYIYIYIRYLSDLICLPHSLISSVSLSGFASLHRSAHRHGVKQPRNPWSDGPEYITQCHIKPGTNYTYKVIFSDEEGTLWWHAHSDWTLSSVRTLSSVHGAIVILPVEGTTYPFPEPDEEQIIVLGSWFTFDLNKKLHYDQDLCWFLGMRTLPLSVSKPWKRTKLRRQSFNFGVNIGMRKQGGGKAA
ncbi:unnamed protein product [Camellia sinensis]